MTLKTALVIEGGAMRSVFSAGLLDRFLQQQFDPFDLCIGVSGGACNLLGYLAGAEGKSLNIYRTVIAHKSFISYRRFLTGGNLIDIDWLTWFIFSNDSLLPANLPLDRRPLLIATTDVDSGQANYVRATRDNLKDALTASMSLPLLYRHFPLLDGRPKTDGGVAAHIPIAKAIALGATRIMVVRSRPREFKKRDTLGHRWIRYKLRRHRCLVATMRQRVALHQCAVTLLQTPPAGIHIVDVCPPQNFTAGRFSRSLRILEQGYASGLNAADHAIREWARL